MLTSLPFSILVGVILGFLAGLGVGGGSLLILWLTLVMQQDPGTARIINLMFFLTAAGSVSIFRWKRRSIQSKEILPAIICGCIAAALFSYLGQIIDQALARRLFGLLLLFTGSRELFYRPRNAR